ncbi:putative integral membrane protein [Clostridium sp. CAG:448]|nr:putative integral membrane protein [Clostridium sp. CAG:448]
MDLTMTLVWLGVFLLSIFLEAQAPVLTAIWFFPGAVICMVLAIFGVPLWVQLVVFFAVSAILLLLTKTVFKNRFKKNNPTIATNCETMVGQVAIVEEYVDNLEATGAAKYKGQLWTARMEDDSQHAQIGDQVEIIRIEGCKLICRKK